jgi:hypothetical protein
MPAYPCAAGAVIQEDAQMKEITMRKVHACGNCRLAALDARDCANHANSTGE